MVHTLEADTALHDGLDSSGPGPARLRRPTPAWTATRVGAEHLPGTALDVAAVRNLRAMHLLERIAARFNTAHIPLLVLKGAALNLTLYDRPDERPMEDIDVLIRPEDMDAACALLEQLGGSRGEPLVRADFFPRFHYEVEYFLGTIYPVKVDVHVRPFRPLRYSRFVPADALWARAEPVRIGGAVVLAPSAEDMLVHLAAHAAIHGSVRAKWARDIKLWAAARGAEIDWDRVLATVEDWHLALPVREGLQGTEKELGPVCPAEVSERLARMPVNWRDRLALHQAPRDVDHPAAHVLVDVLCTPGWRFALAYLSAVAVPDRQHMSGWYDRRHLAWLQWAHVLRWLGPITSRVCGGRRGPCGDREPKRRASPFSRPHHMHITSTESATTRTVEPVPTRPHWANRGVRVVPRRRRGVRECRLDGQAVLVHPKTGNTYQLNRTASAVWHRCDGRTTTRQIAREQADACQVEPEIVLDHVEQLVALLAEAQLLEVGIDL